MKKRIISLVLAIVMVAGLLVSCGYSFAEDDMSSYTTFDKEAFVTALKGLKIADGDFTTDEATRQKKWDDAIQKALSGVAEKKTDGKLSDYDVLYYCYYVTCDLNGDGDITPTEIFNASSMKESSATKLQVGLKDVDEDSLDYKIYQALKDFEFKGKTETPAEQEGGEPTVDYGSNYLTATSTDKAAAGQLVYLTYTVSYIPHKEGSETEWADTATEKTYTNIAVVLGEDAFSAKIIGKEAGKSIAAFDLTAEEAGFDFATKDGVHYTAVTLNWIVKAGADINITVTDTTYDSTKTLTTVEKQSTYPDVKDKELTYHIYPVYFMETPEISWKNIVEDLLGTNVYSTVLDVFADEDIKTADGTTLKMLIDGDKDKELTALWELIYNDLYYPTDREEDKLKDDEKTTAELVKERMDAIEALVNATDGVADRIVSEYKDYIYDGLETTYNNQIKSNVAKEIYDLIEKSVVMKEGNPLPEKAVDDVYYILMQNHQYTFYTGSSKVNNVDTSYYAQYGSFDKYLIAIFTKDGKGPANRKEAEAMVRDDAEAFVTDLVKLYAVADAYDLVISDKEYKEMTYDDPYYQSNVSKFGDIGVRTAYQFEKLYNELLIIEGEQDAMDAYEDAVENGDKDAKYEFDFDYVNGLIPFVHVKYEIKAAE